MLSCADVFFYKLFEIELRTTSNGCFVSDDNRLHYTIYAGGEVLFVADSKAGTVWALSEAEAIKGQQILIDRVAGPNLPAEIIRRDPKTLRELFQDAIRKDDGHSD